MTLFERTRSAALPESVAPLLVVTIDTEEEFDWFQPFSTDTRSVENIGVQSRAQEIFTRFGIRPTYLVDYPVADQPAGYGPIREFAQDDLCDIGAHLQAWVNPPHEETVTAYNSFPGNLPATLEREKLKRLVERIEETIGARAVTYRAGRYGIGGDTPGILRALGFTTDLSILARVDYRPIGGPDFSAFDGNPFWWDNDNILFGLPVTSDYVGGLSGYGAELFSRISGPVATALHIPGLFARTRLLERIRLTPEGMTLNEMKRLTAARLAAGQRVFCLTYHSPSLLPGCTPYVRTEHDLAKFLERLETYFDYFTSEVGGRFATPVEVRDLALAANAADAA